MNGGPMDAKYDNNSMQRNQSLHSTQRLILSAIYVTTNIAFNPQPLFISDNISQQIPMNTWNINHMPQ